MNRFKFIFKNLFTTYNIIIIIVYMLASMLIVMSLSLIYLHTIFDIVFAIPFITIIGLHLGLDINKLNLRYNLNLINERYALDNFHRTREQLMQITEVQNRIIVLLEDLEKKRARQKLHPDDRIINTIEDIYE